MALSSSSGGGWRAHPRASLYSPRGRQLEARSTAQLYSAVWPSELWAQVRGGGGRASLGRLWTPWPAYGRGGLRSQTPPGLLCPPHLESPTPGGNCSPAPSAVAALSAPPLLPAPAGRMRGEGLQGTRASGDWPCGEGRDLAPALRKGISIQLPEIPAAQKVVRLGLVRMPLAMLSTPLHQSRVKAWSSRAGD